MNRANWIENKAIPDSINMNIIARSVSPAVAPKIRLFEEALTSRNTLNSLNTINPVTSAFTVMEMARPVSIKMSPQTGIEILPWMMYIAVARPAVIQIARGNNHELEINESVIRNSSTNLRMRMLRIKERSRHGYCDPIQSNNGISLNVSMNKSNNRHRQMCVLG